MKDMLRRLFGRPSRSPAEIPPPTVRPAVPEEHAGTGPPAAPAPITRQVLMIVHDPLLRSQGGRRLHEHFSWHDPDDLAQRYIDDVREASHGYANYAIAERIVVDGLPLKVDGFRYDERSYLAGWRGAGGPLNLAAPGAGAGGPLNLAAPGAGAGFHQPDTMDYAGLVHEHHILERVAGGAADEVWLFGPPYAGYYESIMGGPGAFWCNAPPLAGAAQSALPGARRYVIMGFNYERGVGEMLEDLGHRAESILSHVYAAHRGGENLFERFVRYDRTCPGCAECGNVHFAPNSRADYDWGNTRPVPSRCDTWYRFPDLSGEPRVVDCHEWGGGDIRRHHLWWLRHFPHVDGAAHGVSWNWWEYVIDPGRAG